jgi:hypothetical protein
VLDRLVHSRDVVAQSDPDLFIVDSVIGVRGDDPHAFALPPGNLRHHFDDLIRQLGGNVAQSADDGLACEVQRALGVPALLPKLLVRLLRQLPQPGLPEGHRLLWSQIHGLGANPVVAGLESTPCDDVHSDAQEVLQILEQADVIKEGRAWLEIHEQI